MERAARFTLTPDDLRAALRLQLVSSFKRPQTWLRLVATWALALVALAGFYGAAGMPWTEMRETIDALAVVFAAVILFTPVTLSFVFGELTIRKRFRQEKALADEASVSWDAEAYEIRTRTIFNRIPWSDYVKWRENDRLFLLYPSDVNYQLLPKRALTEAQIEDFRGFLGRPR